MRRLTLLTASDELTNAKIFKRHNSILDHVNTFNRTSYLCLDDQDSQTRFDHSTRSSTPMPVETMSSPAWNPAADNATQEIIVSVNQVLDNQVANAADNCDESIPTYNHVLLNPALAGNIIKATIDDGNERKKDCVVSLHCINGVCSMRTTHYHTSVLLEGRNVTPKYPSPTHDNGLVLIIKGEHAGKHGRRLYHSKKNGQVYMILEVVVVQEGQKDTLTGQTLELSLDYLCVANESAKQKKINTDVMKESRHKYRSQLKEP